MFNSLYLLDLLGNKIAMAAKARYVLREGFHRMGVQHILRNNPRSVPFTFSEWNNIVGVEVSNGDHVEFTGVSFVLNQCSFS